ncbi:TPR-like protein [Magnetospirillum sp. LM-5]|uniref:SPOR domain-containing protein n=1 Tax=Magnetospirillum sp. LM-5 TaxID=2681466 RepID=UPI0013858152|nr:SPOR domain-containing protein [Magnetospirillum sp. LM-5]CAA7613794.1 TPR-like protein [Magnetospirillum sp. LM-5]
MSTLSGLGRSTAMAVVVLAFAACAPFVDPQGANNTMGGIANSGAADRAMSALTRGDYVTAERQAMVALHYNPKDATALVVAGMAYQGMGRYDLARQYYEVIITTQTPGSIMAPGDGGVVMPRSIIDVARANMALIDKITGRHIPRSAAESGRAPGASAIGGPPLPSMDGAQALYPGAPRPMVSAGGMDPIGQTGMPIRVSDAETNVAGRFRILKRLLDDGLITADEFARRRAANAGALLPYTLQPGAAGLERPIPSEDAVATRLRDLTATLETRAITPAQHSAERTVILDALLPDKPKRLDNPPLPPRDMLEAGQAVGRLERLRAAGLITADEAQKERAAIERNYETVIGAHSVAGTASGARPAPAQGTATNGAAKNWGINLAAAKSEEDAQAVWERIKAKFPEELGKMSAGYRNVAAAGKPARWRVVAGPVANKAAAAKLCKTLKLHRQSCDPANY